MIEIFAKAVISVLLAIGLVLFTDLEPFPAVVIAIALTWGGWWAFLWACEVWD